MLCHDVHTGPLTQRPRGKEATVLQTAGFANGLRSLMFTPVLWAQKSQHAARTSAKRKLNLTFFALLLRAESPSAPHRCQWESARVRGQLLPSRPVGVCTNVRTPKNVQNETWESAPLRCQCPVSVRADVCGPKNTHARPKLVQHRCQTAGGATLGAALLWLRQQRLHPRYIALRRGQFLM